MSDDQNAKERDAPLAPEELVRNKGTVLPDGEAMSTIAPDGPITEPGIPFLPEPVDH